MATAYPKITLKKQKIAAVQRFHPWIFSGAIAQMERPIEDGEIVEVVAPNGQFLAIGYYQDATIAVRVLSFERTEINTAFWAEKLDRAVAVRQRLGLLEAPDTNAFRLIHAEGDGVPGLIIDLYGSTAVVQCHAIGIHKVLDAIGAALMAHEKLGIEAVYSKSQQTLPRDYAQGKADGYIAGEDTGSYQVVENSNVFKVDWQEGQKTGFFLDQRENRALLAQYAAGKRVLNTFCYSGGFSVYALNAGATHVDSVDVSSKAMTLTDQNIALNASIKGTHASHCADVLQYFKALPVEAQYDIVVVDPPAYAKSQKARHNAVQGYKRLNAAAFAHVKPGGLMFTFSCSQVVDAVLFQNTIVAAALEAKRSVRILHRLSQPGDHPTQLFHPEGSYLKGLVLYVE